MSADHFYRELDPSLPDIGWRGPVPRVPTAADAAAIHACASAPALGAMLGAARAFWGSAGLIAIASFGGAACASAGWPVAASIVFALGLPGTLGWIETRRRARQWEALIGSRITLLAGGD